MSKIIAIGDIHGRVTWKNIVTKELESSDKIIFMGDYFDTHGDDINGNEQITNFKEILELKKSYPNKVILLIGNHCYHYIRGIGENYSGYQADCAIDIGVIIDEAISQDLVQMCFVHDKYVFTHAGITKTWCADNEIDMSNLEQSINDLFKFKPRCFKFTMGINGSNTGNDITQSPIWVRPQSLYNDMIDGVVCVVGHTTVKFLDINKDFEKLIMIDCLGTSGEYLVITDGIASKSN